MAGDATIRASDRARATKRPFKSFGGDALSDRVTATFFTAPVVLTLAPTFFLAHDQTKGLFVSFPSFLMRWWRPHH